MSIGVTTPALPADQIARRSFYGDGLQTLAELTAILPADRADKQYRLVEDEGGHWRFDLESALASNPPTVLVPDDSPATGRWILDPSVPSAHTHPASDITDFDTEVGNNSTVVANTSKVSADGLVTTHSDVTDAGSGAIITAGERSAITTNSGKVSADGSVATHSDVTAPQATAIGNLTGTNSGDEVAATETVQGKAELATQAETDTGTDDLRIVTPKKLAAWEADKLDFDEDNVSPPAYDEGRLFYDKNSHSLSYFNDEPDLTLNIGREMVHRVKNETGVLIDNGAVVHFTGVDGVEGVPTVALSKADAAATGIANGVATHTIEDGTFGYITTKGIVHDMDTSGLAVGFVWLSPTVAAGLTTTEPTSPNQKVLVGFVTEVDGSVGQLVVSIENISLVTERTRFGWAIPGTDDSVATQHDVSTSRDARLSAVTVDGVPTSQNHDDGNTGNVLVEITTMTASGTLRLTGTSWDPDTQSETGADTEDIIIGSTGWYESTKHWRGTVVLSSVASLDVVLDSYTWHPRMQGMDYTLDSVQAVYKSTAVSNISRIVLQKFTPITGFATIVDETIADITTATIGEQHHSSLATAIAESSGERLWVFIDTKRVEDYRIEVQGTVI